MKRWTQIYKALANLNRLKIIKLLAKTGKQMTVADIAAEIDISFKGTSKHLILLHNLDVLENQGRDGHVFYSFNQNMPKDVRKAINPFLS
jgi:DNA-binding transcriptional ArsR family regulator